MKYLNTVLIILAIFATGSIVSCGNTPSQDEKKESVDKSGPEYSSAYICPMHCEGSGSAEAGKCPVCGMNYVANESTGHGHDHDGHDHGDHDGHNH